MTTEYGGYFRKQYRYNYTREDLVCWCEWFHSQYILVNAKVRVLPGDKVLEIGSGIGGLRRLLGPDVRYTGIELDEEAVAFACEHFGEQCFQKVSIEEFPESNDFNHVFAFEVLEHLRDPIAVIEKVRRVLKPGGCFCGTSPYPFKRNVLTDETHLFVLHPENWKALFLSNGYSNVELYPMTLFPLLWRFNKRLNPVLPAYINLRYFVSTCLIIAWV